MILRSTRHALCSTIAAALIIIVALTVVSAAQQTPVVTQHNKAARLIADTTPTATLTPTPTTHPWYPWCPTLTPEPLWVEPVTSPTDQLGQVVVVRIGNGEAVTVTLESGVFTATGSFDAYYHPALVDVALLPNTRHTLAVAARVRSWYLWEGCVIGGYTLHAMSDRNGKPLVIEQRSGTITPTASATPTQTPTITPTVTPTATPTPTLCPLSTPEPLWVEPVISPTDLLTQTITVRIGNGEAVTVTAESGVFTATGSFGVYSNPARLTIDLLANAQHHLEVWARVRRIEQWGCVFGDYTLRTTRDRYGLPLLIEQRSAAHACYLPMILR